MQAIGWATPLMIGGGVGMGAATGLLATGLIYTARAKTDDEAGTWTGVAAAGGILGGLSLAGLIVGWAGIASRQAPPPQFTIAPAVGGNPKEKEGGVKIEGKF